MSVFGLTTDKLIPVDLPQVCAPRGALLSRLDEACDGRYAYIGAPAGCGKTVTALLWLQKTGRKTIWLGLDGYDNTPAAFYRFFCTALFSAVSQDERLIALVRDPAFGASPVEYTIEVLSRMVFDEREYALVFDDFHLIDDEEIIKSLLYVLNRLPLSVTVLFLSRAALPQVFFPLCESGKISLVGAEELAFDADEIRRYFASLGRFVTGEEAAQAFCETEGWAIAVNALAISQSPASGEDQKRNPLEKYIRTQIWDKLDGRLRRFMLETCAVDKLSAGLCEQMTQDPESREILDMLSCRNMFLSRQDGEYRYHQLFLDFLRREAETADPAGRHTLYRRAAGYYSCAGDHFNALRFSLKGEDDQGVADAMFKFLKNAALTNSEVAKIRFITALPADVLRRQPFLYIVCAWYALLFGNAKSLYYYLDRLYERIVDIMKMYTPFLEGMMLLFTVDPRHSFAVQMQRLYACGAFVPENENVPKSINHNQPYFHRTYRDYSHYALDMKASFDEFRQTFSGLLGPDYPVISKGIKAGILYEKNLLREALALLRPDPATTSSELVFL